MRETRRCNVNSTCISFCRRRIFIISSSCSNSRIGISGCIYLICLPLRRGLNKNNGRHIDLCSCQLLYTPLSLFFFHWMLSCFLRSPFLLILLFTSCHSSHKWKDRGRTHIEGNRRKEKKTENVSQGRRYHLPSFPASASVITRKSLFFATSAWTFLPDSHLQL